MPRRSSGEETPAKAPTKARAGEDNKYRTEKHLRTLFTRIRKMRKEVVADVDRYGADKISDTAATPDGRFRYLVGLLLSSQTRDPITAQAVFRLDRFLPLTSPVAARTRRAIEAYSATSIAENKTHRLTIDNVRRSDADAIAMLIKPAGFYNEKARNLITIAKTIDDVPDTLEGLQALPGIGPKMATICLRLCYGKSEGIAVDTHMQRICQKLGLAGNTDLTASAIQVEHDLEDWVPRKMWPEFNGLIVGFGQTICNARNPQCDDCTIRRWCVDGE